jgi:hypothetical protein
MLHSGIGKRAGESVKRERGAEYYSTIDRKGGEAQTAAEKPQVQPADVNTDASWTILHLIIGRFKATYSGTL